MADSKKSDDDGNLVLVFLAGAVVLALIVVPAILGYALFFAGRRHFGRRENVALTLIGLAGLIGSAGSSFGGYGRWLGQLVHQHWTAMPPLLALALMAMLFGGVFGLVTGTRIVSKFGRVFNNAPGKTIKSGRLVGGKSSAGDDEVLPDIEVRRKAHEATKIVSGPGNGAHLIDADAQSIIAPQAPGKRQFPIGFAIDGSPVYLSEAEIGTHMLILGSTGSGKSETIKALAGALLDLGWSGLLLDLKEDTKPGGLRDWCQEYAIAHSIPFQELRLSDSQSKTWFNPLHGMEADEMRDTILSLQEFEAAYYEALNKELLGQVVNLCMYAHQADPTQFAYPSMYDIAKLIGTPSLANATKKMRAVVEATVPGITKDDFRVLATPSQDQQTSAVGFGSRLGNIYDSQAGRITLRPGNGRELLDVTRDGLTYIGLDSMGKPDLTRVISSAVLQRLSVYASQRTTGSSSSTVQRFVIIDEANWINREITQNLLSRARSAGITMCLCTQGPKDWIDQKGDDWGKLANNINVAIIMVQKDPESAELAAKFLGETVKTKVGESISQTQGGLLGGPRRMTNSDGKLVEQFSVKEEIDYVIQPYQLRNLTVGEAVIRVGTPTSRLVYTRIQQRDPKAHPRLR